MADRDAETLKDDLRTGTPFWVRTPHSTVTAERKLDGRHVEVVVVGAGISGALLAMFQASIQANAFTSTMTYEILLIVVIGGIGSVTGSILGSFLYIACSEWWLRFLDDPMPYLGVNIPFMRGGFRMLVFSVIIMIVVLFFRKGIMGDRELFQKKPTSAAKAVKKEVRSK